MELKPEPTDDGEPIPTAFNEPVQYRATERRIAPEKEPNPSDQVREPATVPAAREQAVDGESAEWSSAPCTATEGELIVHLGLLDLEGDLIDWETDLEADLPPLLSPSSPLAPSSPPSSPVPTSSPEWAPVSQSSRERDSVPESSQEWALISEGSPESPEAHECPPTRTLLPPPLLSSGSPSARPQPTIYTVRAPRVCHFFFFLRN